MTAPLILPFEGKTPRIHESARGAVIMDHSRELHGRALVDGARRFGVAVAGLQEWRMQ